MACYIQYKNISNRGSQKLGGNKTRQDVGETGCSFVKTFLVNVREGVQIMANVLCHFHLQPSIA